MKLALVLLLLAPQPALAHDFSPGVLSLEELESGRYRYTWTAPVDSGAPVAVEVRFPSGCTRAESIVDCRPGELEGAIEFPGLAQQRAQVVVTVQRLGGVRDEAMVWGDDPRFVIGAARSTFGWVGVGVEHVLTGYDHLAFVLGLLLVTGFRRRIILTITSFTVAHSLTLALAALHLVHLPRAPVEATIAASVLLVARESTHDAPTLTRRFPWAVALLFGLIHGLGFAGALEDLGLPRDSLALTLLSFNVGVELGQLSVVGVALSIATVGSRFVRPRSLRAVSYVLGAFAAYWLIERTVAIMAAS